MKALRLELFKTRRKKFWLIVLAIIGVQGLWLAWGMRDLDAQTLAQGYAGCFYQLPLTNAIVLPILVAVLVSRLCDLEHKGVMLKELLTMQPASTIFNSKLICSAIYLAVAILLQLVIIRVLGYYRGFQDLPSLSDFAIYFGSQFLVSMFLAVLLQILALKYVNQFIPLVVGLISGFLGLMAMFFPPWVMRLVPSAYYGLLSTVGMNWDRSTRIVDYYHVPFSLPDCLLLVAVLIVFYLIGLCNFRHREV